MYTGAASLREHILIHEYRFEIEDLCVRQFTQPTIYIIGRSRSLPEPGQELPTAHSELRLGSSGRSLLLDHSPMLRRPLAGILFFDQLPKLRRPLAGSLLLDHLPKLRRLRRWMIRFGRCLFNVDMHCWDTVRGLQQILGSERCWHDERRRFPPFWQDFRHPPRVSVYLFQILDLFRVIFKHARNPRMPV